MVLTAGARFIMGDGRLREWGPKVKYLTEFSAALMMSVSSLAAAPGKLKYADLIGIWRVSGVAVNSDGMSTLVDDDPQFLGAVLEFSVDKIVWLNGTPARSIVPEVDNCDAPPKVTSAGPDNPASNFQVEGGFNVLCGDEDWGPGGVVQPVDADTMILRWYDNGLLRLLRQ